MLKEMVKNNSPKQGESKKSPVDQALEAFQKENGYDFLEMANNPRTRAKHLLKQMQKPDYSDNDFLEKHQDYQGD